MPFIRLSLSSYLLLLTSLFPDRPADPTAELLREHLQPQQSDQYVQHGQPEGPGCQEEEEKELGKRVWDEPADLYNSSVHTSVVMNRPVSVNGLSHLKLLCSPPPLIIGH